jgi:Ser/Thr protein kinase RdoA (MazF antagonist)
MRVTSHIRRKLEESGGDPLRGTLTVIPALGGQAFHKTPKGDYWRCYVFIEGAQTYDVIPDQDMVYEASYAFGRFQKMLADLPGARLHESIADFHHTRKRFEAFLVAVNRDVKNRAKAVKAEIEFTQNRAQDAGRLISLMAEGKLPERITHNDTKFNNVMIDDKTGKGVCVIDLDTVMPGLSVCDFGDSVRIGASTAAEDERDLSKVSMALSMFDRLAEGYLAVAREFLTGAEMDELAFSAKLLTLECGMRFLTDHLNGDVYFSKISHPNHNLDRCRTQYKMVADMEEKMERMEEIVNRYRTAE